MLIIFSIIFLRNTLLLILLFLFLELFLDLQSFIDLSLRLHFLLKISLDLQFMLQFSHFSKLLLHVASVLYFGFVWCGEFANSVHPCVVGSWLIVFLRWRDDANAGLIL